MLYCCDIILPFLLPHCFLPLFASTNRQADSSAGVLDYCEEPAVAPSLNPSLPSRVGDSSFSFGLSPQTWSGSAYQFSLVWNDRNHIWEHPHILFHFNKDLRARPLMDWHCALAGSLLSVKYLKWSEVSCVFRRNTLERGNNRSVFNPATRGCTLNEPGPRSHLTLLIPHLATCPCF